MDEGITLNSKFIDEDRQLALSSGLPSFIINYHRDLVCTFLSGGVRVNDKFTPFSTKFMSAMNKHYKQIIRDLYFNLRVHGIVVVQVPNKPSKRKDADKETKERLSSDEIKKKIVESFQKAETVNPTFDEDFELNVLDLTDVYLNFKKVNGKRVWRVFERNEDDGSKNALNSLTFKYNEKEIKDVHVFMPTDVIVRDVNGNGYYLCSPIRVARQAILRYEKALLNVEQAIRRGASPQHAIVSEVRKWNAASEDPTMHLDPLGVGEQQVVRDSIQAEEDDKDIDQYKSFHQFLLNYLNSLKSIETQLRQMEDQNESIVMTVKEMEKARNDFQRWLSSPGVFLPRGSRPVPLPHPSIPSVFNEYQELNLRMIAITFHISISVLTGIFTGNTSAAQGMAAMRDLQATFTNNMQEEITRIVTQLFLLSRGGTDTDLVVQLVKKLKSQKNGEGLSSEEMESLVRYSNVEFSLVFRPKVEDEVLDRLYDRGVINWPAYQGLLLEMHRLPDEQRKNTPHQNPSLLPALEAPRSSASSDPDVKKVKKDVDAERPSKKAKTEDKA